MAYNPSASLAEQRFRKLGGSKAAFRAATKGQTLVSLDLMGAESLEECLIGLGSDRAIYATLKRAVIKALEPTAKAARQKAPKAASAFKTASGRTIDPGEYAESIDVSAKLSRRQKTSHPNYTGPTSAEAFVGPKPSKPGVILEFGTSHRYWRNGKSVGFSPAHPHMRPAWEETKTEVLELLGKMLWVEIAATAKRLRAKQARALKKGSGK